MSHIHIYVYSWKLKMSWFMSLGMQCMHLNHTPKLYWVMDMDFYTHINNSNRPNLQSHSAPFRTEIRTFLIWMEHCGIWNKCVLGFVKLIDCIKTPACLPVDSLHLPNTVVHGIFLDTKGYVQYIPRNMHTVFALLCFFCGYTLTDFPISIRLT